MEILEVHKIEYYLITTDEEGWNTYRRNIHGILIAGKFLSEKAGNIFIILMNLKNYSNIKLKTQLIYVHRFTKSDEDYGII